MFPAKSLFFSPGGGEPVSNLMRGRQVSVFELFDRETFLADVIHARQELAAHRASGITVRPRNEQGVG